MAMTLMSNRKVSGFEHLRSVLLSGGRMTKHKGQAASYAPSFGMAVSAIALTAVLGLASPARAANECGADASGADTIVCNGDGTPATDVENQTAVIRYTDSDGCQASIYG